MIVSIDIGTSYSSICILGPDGKAQPVDISTGASMFGGKYSLPSAVFVEDGGNILVGQAALNSRRRRPQNFRMEFKRNLGEDTPVLLGERSFHTEDLYTELFLYMKARAEQVTGESVGRTFLTYPASYGKDRRERLCSAARAAGLFDLQLVDEPTAAAMCYCAQGYIKDGQTLLVYDFGGGTFDTALIRYEDGRFTHLAQTAGLERCGGMDIDYLIAQDMHRAIEEEYPGTWDRLKENKERHMRLTVRLNELAVKAKHHLSSAGLYEDTIEVGMDDVFYRLTREQLNQMTASLVGQTVSVCRQMLADAGVSASDLSAVLLVGGTSRIPLVQEMAGKIMGKPPLCAADLELSVAQGPLMYLHKQEEIEREQKKRQEAEERRLQQEREKQKMQQQAKELEEKLKKEREEAAAREKARREAEERESRKRESEAAEKSRREAEERERQRGDARQKKEDEDLVLGRYAEEFISSYPYVKKGVRDFDETYVAMYRAQVNMPVQEKVLLAASIYKPDREGLLKGLVHGTVFTNRGIYHISLDINQEGYFVLNDHFTSWKKFAVSKLDIYSGKRDLAADIVTLNFSGSFSMYVQISGEEIAYIYLDRESKKTQRAMQYEFFPALQQYLLSKM